MIYPPPRFPDSSPAIALLRGIVLLGAVLSAIASTTNAATVRGEHIEVELVSELDAVVPGKAFTLALRLKHDPEWSTAWHGTFFEIAMPDGFVAGPVRWPAPEMGIYLGSRTYSCSGEIFLAVEITPPDSLAPGTTVEFATDIGVWTWKGDANTTMEADLAITLPVSATPGQDTPWGAALRKTLATLPASSPDLAVTGYRQGQKITLVVDAARDLNPAASEFQFFEEEQQLETRLNDTEWRARRQVRIAAKEVLIDPQPTRLAGVLRAKGGWFKDGAELHTVDFALIDGPPPPTVPLGSLAAAVLRHLDSTPEYRQLRALYARNRDEAGPQWVKSRYAERLLATLDRLRAEAASASTIDPEHPEKRAVNFIAHGGSVLRLGSIVPSRVAVDESYHHGVGAIISRFILERATEEGVLVIPPPSPAAREPIARGIAAAKRQDYALAIRGFEEARALAPRAPEVYFNLGLAESKRPGHELRAIAWFGAYLTADPYAPAWNEAAVLKQMNLLREKNRANLASWLRAVQNAAVRLASGDSDRWYFVLQTVILWAQAGEIAAAQKAAALIPVSNHGYCFSLHEIVRAQLKAGDISGAHATANTIKDRYTLSVASTRAGTSYAGERTEVASTLANAQTDIAEAEIRAGDNVAGKKTLVAARNSAALIRYATYEALVQPAIAEALVHAGEHGEAKAVLALARKVVDANPEPNSKISELLGIARVQLAAGDATGAATTFAFAAGVAGAAKKNEYAGQMAAAQAAGGDIAGAQATIARITDNSIQDTARVAVVRAQAGRGDLPGARATTRMVADKYDNSRARLAIIEAAENRGEVREDWLGVLLETDSIQDCPLSDPVFTDLAGYLKSLAKTNEPTSYFESLRTISTLQIRAHHAIDRMLGELTK